MILIQTTKLMKLIRPRLFLLISVLSHHVNWMFYFSVLKYLLIIGCVELNPGGDTSSRDPMGKYIVPVDGKPLTSLGEPTPGPADYLPRIHSTKESLPHYSIAGKYKTKTHNDNPGPSDFSTSGDLIWKQKTASLKGRDKCYFDVEAKKYCTVFGPAKYNSKYLQCCKNSGPKYSIARKQPSDICTGPPNSRVQPVDSHGFQTPGPNYRPNSSYFGRGPKKSFGIRSKAPYREFPGPSDYSIGDKGGGPSHSFGSKLPPPPNIQRTVNKHSPAPNTYDLGTTIGKATSVIIATRKKEKQYPQDNPSPAAYYRRDTLQYSKRAITLAYRWFDPDEPVRPGPADYTLTDSNLSKSPRFTNRTKTAPSYPESLNYTSRDVKEHPGPGSYNTTKRFSSNDSPAYKIGEKLKSKSDENPSPNVYEYEKHKISGPSFSMGKRFEVPENKVSPGPAAYFPSEIAGTPKYSMTARPMNIKADGGPAPNAYNLQETGIGGGNNNGTTLKSRASPYVYSGFRTTKLLEDSSTGVVAT